MFKKTTQVFIAKSIGLYINLLSYVMPNRAFKLAYKFFSEPRKGKIDPNKIPKTLNNSEHSLHSHNNHQIQTYTWKGNDEIVLLVHGWESNSSRWSKLLPFLKNTGKTIISIDAPAHGLSSGTEFNVPQYAEFIDFIVQKYNPKIAIGHSLGGNTIAYFQAHYNNNFEKIILLGVPSDFKIILNNYIKMLSLNSKIHNAFINYTKERFNIIVEEFSASKFMKNNNAKGIVAHDIDDKVVLFEEGGKIYNSWKNSKFIETKNLGHSMHDEDLYKALINFIEN